MNDLEKFISKNFPKVLKEESKKALGDRSKYIGASDIGGCPYKTIMDKKNPPEYSIRQLIIFERGHLAEQLVNKMLKGLNIVDQYEVLGRIDTMELKAHIDKIIKGKNKDVLIEVKTVSAPVDNPYESWVLQVQYQMGLLKQEKKELYGYVLALDLNTGWFKTFEIEFDQALFQICLNKAAHLADALKGIVEPKAIPQGYCSSCHYKMSCPALGGRIDKEIPEEIKDDVIFIKRYKEMAKEAKAREERLKEYLVNMGIKEIKDDDIDAMVSISESNINRFDTYRFKKEHPDLYNKYIKTGSSFRMKIL